MMKLAPEWVRTSDPVIRSPARYRWTTAPAYWSGAITECVRGIVDPIAPDEAILLLLSVNNTEC